MTINIEQNQGDNMTSENNWTRPKKPYTVTPYATSQAQAHVAKPKPKKVVTPARNNTNNKVLHDCLRANGLIKITINNELSTDPSLLACYIGHIKSFDDFTILIETSDSSYLINKSAIAVVEFLKNESTTE